MLIELDAITTTLLEDTLKAWQHSEDPPPELLALQVLGASSSNSLAERSIFLYDWLVSMAQQAMGRHRRDVGLSHTGQPPASRRGLLKALASDFERGHAQLQAWSALYHCYLTDYRLSINDLAEAAMAKMARDKPRQFRRRVKEGLRYMVDALRRAELHARQRPRDLCPPPRDYIRLFGVDELLTGLAALLSASDGPGFVSLEGIGGIGKTALAHAVTDRLDKDNRFVDILWISARHQELVTECGEIESLNDPVRSMDDIITRLAQKLVKERLAGFSTEDKLKRLAPLLAAKPYLVVVDNLETLNDTQELLPALSRLGGPTRFVLTSRQTLGRFPYVHLVPVPDLSFSDSHALMETELQRHGKCDSLPIELAESIYQIIGGLPLALKLVAALMGRLSLSRILKDLREASQQAPEAMYTYIYRRTWKLLSEPARLLLLSLQLISPDGEDRQWIRDNSQLTEPDFDTAMGQLLAHSLLERSGSLDRPHYHLHRLTYTFLRTEVLTSWMEQ